jgi:putative ABC transport system ATP-binding protein
MIEIRNCLKVYDQNNIVLDYANLSIKAGEMVAIIGESGVGKSTLLNIIGTVDKMDEGKYFFDNKEISKYKNKAIAQFRTKNIGFVFQLYYLIPQLTVYENLDIPLNYAKIPLKLRDEMILNVLKQLSVEHLKNKNVDNLSGGEKQRVAIARALINQPKVIIADEPTGNLDNKNTINIMKLFHNINKEGTTIIIVTHDLEIAGQCQKVYEIINGKIIERNLN